MESQLNEADTCRKYVEPRLIQSGWDNEPHSFTEQQNFTDGRIIIVGDKPKRRKKKRADYLLRFARDFKIAVVEAKPRYKNPGDGLQQAEWKIYPLSEFFTEEYFETKKLLHLYQ